MTTISNEVFADIADDVDSIPLRLGPDTLIPLDGPDLPKLDSPKLPGWAGRFAKSLAESTQTPLELAVGMVLAACATATARRLRIESNPGHYETSNLWVLVALPPGNRKSSVQAAATAPLLAWERDQAETLAPKINRAAGERQNMEAKIKALRNSAVKEKDRIKQDQMFDDVIELQMNLPDVPVYPQLWTSDATPERLGSLLADQNECMAWLSSEGGIFDLLAGRYSSGVPNLDLALKAHSGDSERVDRGSREPVNLVRPRLTIGLSPQPEVIRGLLSKGGFRGRGLLGRFLYLVPESPLGFRKLETQPVPPNVENAYRTGLQAMLDWEPVCDEKGRESTRLLRMGKEAYDEWLEFSRNVEAAMRPGGEMEHCTDWAGKAPGAAARIACVLHGIEHAHGRPWEHDVSLQTMEKALDLAATFMRHSIAAFQHMGADPLIEDARKVWHWIVSRRADGFTVRDVFNGLKGSFQRVAGIYKALDVLGERGYIELIRPEHMGPGRPRSPTIRVSDRILREWK